MTIGILVFLSVWSYSPGDARLLGLEKGASVGNSSSGLRNFVGMTGAWLSYGLVWSVGAAAYVVSLLIIVQGIRSLRQESWSSSIRATFGAVLSVICASALLQLSAGSQAAASETSQLSIWNGGVTGLWTATILAQYFGEVGSAILLGAGLLVSLLLITPLSLLSTAQRVLSIWSVVHAGVAWLASLRFPRMGLRLSRVKAHHPVKINRSPAVKSEPVVSETEDLVEEDLQSVGDAAGSRPDVQRADERPSRAIFPRLSRKVAQGYVPPDPMELLDAPVISKRRQTDQILETQSKVLTTALQSFGIGGKVTEVHPGPVITMYEFEPSPGIKVARIVTLSHDLAMALKATSLRIVAPLPGKSTVGIEVPNPERETVALRDILTSETFTRSRSKLALALGKDIYGRPVVADLKTMPHLLVAGATGAGKSVGLNSMLLSILFSAHPDEVKLLLIDPKVLELQVYDGVPHLLRPVITNPKAAARGLTWVVQEMERRYRLLAEHGVRSIHAFNVKVSKQAGRDEDHGAVSVPHQCVLPLDETQLPGLEASTTGGGSTQEVPLEPLPYIVVVIDEFADLMMVAPKDIEEKIARLAQMARASGIHVILATQRPSVDVVTGLIKANFPARIAYQVSSKIDSRTILDSNGAEALLGMGDMLYMASGTARITRLHGSYVSDDDVRRVVEWIKNQAGPAYSEDANMELSVPQEPDTDQDEVYEQARELVLTTGQASASLIQRRLRVGYPRAARMIEQMEEEGLVSAPGRDGRREVLGRRMVKEGVG